MAKGSPDAPVGVALFLQDARAGATALVAAAVAVMSVGGAALIIDHQWLVGQRDLVKSAADAAAVAATIELARARATLDDATLETALLATARRYVELNLKGNLSKARFARAEKTLTVTLGVDRAEGTVAVSASADLGGTLLSRVLPLLGRYAGPETIGVDGGVERIVAPLEVVLAIDMSGSMFAVYSRPAVS